MIEPMDRSLLQDKSEPRKSPLLPISVSPEALLNISREYERHNHTKMDFWSWMFYFEDLTLSLSDIARNTGLSRQRIQQVYLQWFERIFPRRHKARQVPVIRPLLGKAKVLYDYLIEKQKRGELDPKFNIRTIPLSSKAGWSQSKLRIVAPNNTYTCLCVVSRQVQQYGGSHAVYCRLETQAKMLEGIDFILIHHQGYEKEPLCFVLHAGYALERARARDGHISLYLPLRRYKNTKSPHYKYREAWDLLEGETKNGLPRN